MDPRDVKRLRERLGLTQVAFAARIGVSPNSVARWERGELGMRPTTARLIQLVLEREAPVGAKPKRRR